MTELSGRRRQRRDRYARNVLFSAASVLIIAIAAFTVGFPKRPPSHPGIASESRGPALQGSPMDSTAATPSGGMDVWIDQSVLRNIPDSQRTHGVPPPPPPPSPSPPGPPLP